ncbi:porin [Thiorhodospira sibirica]|uniref:porin n=1 Tax=Thiorhodospira sibirica TaxID=154347 RepID=UPI00022C5E06|nr:porin [Thiorhodospira sibirica]
MPTRQQTLLTAALLLTPTLSVAQGLTINYYGSARIHAEAVQPDNTEALESYTGLRDAYSRLGFNAEYPLGHDITAFGQLELPLDLANLAVQDPWDQEQDVRVAHIGLRGGFGTLAYGQMWMPYYNAIAYPVDMFSSYYSGFATYTTFRQGDSISYYSPDMGGFNVALGWSERNGQDGDDRWQVTASYRVADTVVAVGLDDLQGETDSRIYGASLAQTWGDLYLGAKYEWHDSTIAQGYGADGDRAMNLYAGYTLGNTTVKLMLANVENYGEDIVHLGLDHQLTPALLLFAEYYYEEHTAALTEKRGGAKETAWAAEGGEVFAAGVRYDF